MTNRLVFVTHSFPTGVGERWKYDDLRAFSTKFDEVVVVPRVKLVQENKFDFPPNVRIGSSVFSEGEEQPRVLGKLFASLPLGSGWIFELIMILFSGRLEKAKTLIGAAYVAQRTVETLSKNDLFGSDEVETTLLFFWGIGGAEASYILRKKFSKIIVCFHNFDLYKERAVEGYFPFRKQTIRAADVLAPCSQHGADYLEAEFSAPKSKIHVKRLGVEDFGVGHGSDDGVLRIVSCALANPVKRLDMICSVLAECRCAVEWRHFGDGPLLEELKELSTDLLGQLRNIKFSFEGFVDPKAVREMYVTQPFDLFLSLSAHEGVPVSVMEALSAGIPVFATDVGGVSELVDSSVGQLLPKCVTPNAVAELIETYSKKPSTEISALREAARDRADMFCRAPLVNNKFAEEVC